MNDDQLVHELGGTQFEQMLTWAHENEDDPNVASPFDAEAIHEGVKVFLDHGLIDDEFPTAGPFGLTGRGHRIAARLIESRQSGPLRVEDLERSMLRLIGEDNPLATEDIIGTEVRGLAVTEREHKDTVADLRAAALIDGGESFGYDGLTRPELTSRGRQALRARGIPSDLFSSGGTTINNDNRFQNRIKGDVGQAAAGVTVTQSGNQTIFNDWRGEAHEKVTQLRELLAEIDKVPESIGAAFQELEAASADGRAGQPVWRSAVGAFSMAILAKAGEDSYQKVIEVTQALAQLVTQT